MGFIQGRAAWRGLCIVAAATTAAALRLGADDLSHPELHPGVLPGTIQLAHWCFAAAMILMLAALGIIVISRNLGGATVGWFVVAAAGLILYLGGYNLAEAPDHFTPAGAGLAMLAGLASWFIFAVLIGFELRHATGHEAGRRQFA